MFISVQCWFGKVGEEVSSSQALGLHSPAFPCLSSSRVCVGAEKEHTSERGFKEPIGFMIVEKYGKIYRIGQKKA